MITKHIYKKPHVYLWFTSMLAIIIGYTSYFYLGNSALDINVHDTYFVIAHKHLVYGLSVFLFVLGTIYWALQKLNITLIPSFTILHVIITSLFITVILIGQLYFASNITEFLITDNADIFNNNMIKTVLGILFFIAQLLFLINILLSIINYGIRR